jgi:hypothetical protein
VILNRRSFNSSTLAVLLSGAMNSGQSYATGSTSKIMAPLNRLTFGANHESVGRFLKIGLEEWLEQELAKPANDEDLQRRIGSARLMFEYEAGKGDHGISWPARKDKALYQYLGAKGESLLSLLDFDKRSMNYEERIRPAREVQAASLIRAVHADAQLREVMTQFWHDHFNVNSMRDEHTGAYFAIYDAMLRETAFGNFRKMLGEVTRSPSMLFYLNNEASKASPANENFARELFELHTLGAGNYFNDRTTVWDQVPGAQGGLAQGYIDQDVYEAARALTGWSFGDGRYLAENDFAPATGEFHYIDRWHDPYQKRILAVEFKANAGPMADGEKLLNILAQPNSCVQKFADASWPMIHQKHSLKKRLRFGWLMSTLMIKLQKSFARLYFLQNLRKCQRRNSSDPLSFWHLSTGLRVRRLLLQVSILFGRFRRRAGINTSFDHQPGIRIRPSIGPTQTSFQDS